MALQDLNDQLYKRNGEVRPENRQNSFGADVGDENAKQAFAERSAWENRPAQNFLASHRKVWKIAGAVLGGMLLIAIVVVAAVKIRESAFTSDKVTVKVDGPTEVSGSQSSRFSIAYSNANRADLENVEVLVYYPETFRPEGGTNILVKEAFSQVRVGTVAGHSKGTIDFPGKFYGAKGSVVYLRAVLRYKPSTASSEFRTENQLGITVQSSSLAVDVQAPLEVASGGQVEYRVDYTNTSDTTLTNIRMKAQYPEGFRFQSADPKTSEGEAVWYVGNLGPGQKGLVRVMGSMDGARNEAKLIKIQFGTFQGDGGFLAYSETERVTRVVASPLQVVQSVNGLAQANVSPGSMLRYDVQYRNEGDIGLRDVIISVEIRGQVLDFSRLVLAGKGAYDSSRGTIQWKASDVPGLAFVAPGQSGRVSFEVPVRRDIAVASDTDKNFVVVSTAKIDSPDIPTPTGANKIIGSNTLQLKVNSLAALRTLGLYYDPKLSNSGPIPPRVGVETSYTLRWSLANTTNDLDRVQVTSSLPTGVKWLDKIDPSTENISFNSRTNQIVWNVGNVASGTGSLEPVREVAFQVSVVPQSAQLDKEVALLNETTLTARDTFTDETIQAKNAAKTTVLPEDANLPQSSYRVTN